MKVWYNPFWFLNLASRIVVLSLVSCSSNLVSLLSQLTCIFKRIHTCLKLLVSRKAFWYIWWLVLIINLTQCKIIWEESLNEEFSRLDWPTDMSVGGYLELGILIHSRWHYSLSRGSWIASWAKQPFSSLSSSVYFILQERKLRQ